MFARTISGDFFRFLPRPSLTLITEAVPEGWMWGPLGRLEPIKWVNKKIKRGASVADLHSKIFDALHLV